MSNQSASASGRVSGARSLSLDAVSRYFAARDSAGGGSNFGSMCEAASRRTHASVQCRPCEGMGFRVLSERDLAYWRVQLAKTNDTHKQDQIRATITRESTCPVCEGSGYTTPSRADRAMAMDTMFTTVRCGRCRGCGETLNPNDATAEVEDVCVECLGKGHVIPITVREVGSSKGGRPPKRETGKDDEDDDVLDGVQVEGVATAQWVNEDALVELGRISRVMEQLRRDDPELVADLETYNGPEGDKWGAHKWGRLFALWPRTPAGRALAKINADRSKWAHKLKIKPIDLIANERDAKERGQTADPRVRALINQADSQARARWARVLEALSALEAA